MKIVNESLFYKLWVTKVPYKREFLGNMIFIYRHTLDDLTTLILI